MLYYKITMFVLVYLFLGCIYNLATNFIMFDEYKAMCKRKTALSVLTWNGICILAWLPISGHVIVSFIKKYKAAKHRPKHLATKKDK